MSGPFSRLSHVDEEAHERNLKDVGKKVGEEAFHDKNPHFVQFEWRTKERARERTDR